MITYKDAGVDVERGYEAVRLMKEHVKKTFDENVLGELGSFGGFYAIDKLSIDSPVLVAGTDGVGTKLKIAFLLDKHDTIGVDCVAMSANDIVCQGARPLFFLDYLATSRISPQIAGDIVKGIADGCQMAGCALIGGETAEMPDFYAEGEYDLAGFCVGIVGRNDVINGSNIVKGDALIGLASSGPHSNGYSLIRKLLLPDDDAGAKEALSRHVPELSMTLGEALLMPTKLYVKTVLSLASGFPLKGVANITGGGFIENIPRILPDGLRAEINKASYPIPPIFRMLKEAGQMTDEAIYNTFNMGIGMVLCVTPDIAESVIAECAKLGQDAWVIGSVGESANGERIVI